MTTTTTTKTTTISRRPEANMYVKDVITISRRPRVLIYADNTISIDGRHIGLGVRQERYGTTVVWLDYNSANMPPGIELAMPERRYSLATDAGIKHAPGAAQFRADLISALLCGGFARVAA